MRCGHGGWLQQRMDRRATEDSRVLAVDSAESWDLIINQAYVRDCPVVVYFTAEWCAPSKHMKPFFQDLARKYPYILFLQVDVDEVRGAASKMDVKAMPTFLFLKKDRQLDKIVGANVNELQRRVDSFAYMIRQS